MRSYSIRTGAFVCALFSTLINFLPLFSSHFFLMFYPLKPHFLSYTSPDPHDQLNLARLAQPLIILVTVVVSRLCDYLVDYLFFLLECKLPGDR